MAIISSVIDPFERVCARMAQEPAVLVRVLAVQGSAPREPGAWMVVFEQDAEGTIGGGHLEWQAQSFARQHLNDPGWPGQDQRCALGPSLGQCCGGVVRLRYEPCTMDAIRNMREQFFAARVPVALFGGGHVGQAIARALQPLPFALTWVDSREGVFPQTERAAVAVEHSNPVQAAVPGLAPGSFVLIMSFSHAEDLDIVAACLGRCRVRQDLPFVGLIGSQTKWASFRQRLQARGFSESEMAQVTCPIGLPGIVGKQPEVVAASVVAQLLLLASKADTRF